MPMLAETTTEVPTIAVGLLKIILSRSRKIVTLVAFIRGSTNTNSSPDR